MGPWVQVYANLLTHRKTCQLRDKLGFKSNYEAVGLIVSLWLWVAQNAIDGNLTGYSARDIADGIGYKKPPAKLMASLLEVRFLDQDGGGNITVHDWDEHAALLMDAEERRKEGTRERVRKHREKKRKRDSNTPDAPACNGVCNVTGNAYCNVTGNEDFEGCNVTETPCNAPTTPPPDLTVPNQTNITADAAGDTRARESAAAELASEKELALIGIEPGEFFVSKRRVSTVITLTKVLFSRYRPGDTPTAADFRRTFELAVDNDSAQLLGYAFETASAAGKAGDWRYVRGVMERLCLRGIRTVAEARNWDAERPDRGSN